MTKKNAKKDGIDQYHDLDMVEDNADQLRAIYAQWADTYDADNDDKLKTVSQPLTVKMFAQYCSNRDAQILDVGCGTGLVGLHLAQSGFTTFDGTDLSAEMMVRAKTRGYRNLFPLDPNEHLPVEDQSYDATLCVGVFTHGHLGAEGMHDLLRVTKTNGLVCFTVNEGVWETGGFPQEIAQISSQAKWEILKQKRDDYMVNEDVQAWYIAARKL